MDRFSILGLFIGVAAILVGQYLEGGSVITLLNFPAFIIVLGGTIGATLLETPQPTFIRAFKLIKKAFQNHDNYARNHFSNWLTWSKITKKEGFLSLERALVSAKHSDLTRTGLQLLIDGKETDEIEEILRHKLNQKQNTELRAIKVFESMGGYSPTIGIIGAVIGLIHVLGNMGDPQSIGPGIAIAFVATIYGVGFANLVWIPIAKRLKNILIAELTVDALYVDVVVAMREGVTPAKIEATLRLTHEAA